MKIVLMLLLNLNFLSCMEPEKKHPDFEYKKALRLTKQGHREEAKQILEQPEYANYVPAQTQLAFLCMQEQNHERAKKILEPFSNSDYEPALHNLANIYLHEGKLNPAKRLLQKAANNQFSASIDLLAYVSFKMGDLDKARQLYTQLVNKKDNAKLQKSAERRLQQIDYIQKVFPPIKNMAPTNPEQAIELLQDAKLKNFPRALILLAELYCTQKKTNGPKKALTLLHKAVLPKYPELNIKAH